MPETTFTSYLHFMFPVRVEVVVSMVSIIAIPRNLKTYLCPVGDKPLSTWMSSASHVQSKEHGNRPACTASFTILASLDQCHFSPLPELLAFLEEIQRGHGTLQVISFLSSQMGRPPYRKSAAHHDKVILFEAQACQAIHYLTHHCSHVGPAIDAVLQ
jgi:hypothetical protein